MKIIQKIKLTRKLRKNGGAKRRYKITLESRGITIENDYSYYREFYSKENNPARGGKNSLDLTNIWRSVPWDVTYQLL